MANKAVFFDRDGTLNIDIHYLHKTEDFVWTEDAKQAVKYVNDCGYLAILVTNQSGVARGYYAESDVQKVYDYMNDELKKIGAHLDALYYCPHHAAGKIPKYSIDCACRKPKPGMIDSACAKFNIDRTASYLVGDTATDMACAKNAGLTGIFYKGGSLLNIIKKKVKEDIK